MFWICYFLVLTFTTRTGALTVALAHVRTYSLTHTHTHTLIHSCIRALTLAIGPQNALESKMKIPTFTLAHAYTLTLTLNPHTSQASTLANGVQDAADGGDGEQHQDGHGPHHIQKPWVPRGSLHSL
jgi:hypothetical protein